MQPKHQKRTKYTALDDGSVKIESKSYFEKLAHSVEEIEKPMVSSFETLKTDIERALDHFVVDGSPKLVLTIEMKKGRPKITKRWVTIKQDFPRR